MLFLPRASHTTGDIQIHEMTWVSFDRQPPPMFDRQPQACALPTATQQPDNPDAVACGFGSNEPELWFVNTRFSCLCTRDVRYSFVPRWRPPFVTQFAPEDRCHMNGMCVAPSFDRKPQACALQTANSQRGSLNAIACGYGSNDTDNARADGWRPARVPNFFVTALGQTNERGGWRANKRSGGILMETASNEVLLRGLSMPHSPRVHAGQLWLCESGSGTFGRVDLESGRYEPVTVLPGFTRGVDFFGRYAFIGLSQVRESAVFSGIAIAERPVSERACGVWVVDLVTGQTVAWLKFDDGVQEIFAVNVLPGSRWPDVINDDRRLIADSFVLPDEALPAVPNELCCVVEPSRSETMPVRKGELD